MQAESAATAPDVSAPMPARGRLRHLDSLRGIAALFVVFNHLLQIVPEHTRHLAGYPGGWHDPAAWATVWPWLRLTPLRLLVDGQAAVDVFFVLSGFVLALPLAVGIYASVPLRPDPSASEWVNDLLGALSRASPTGDLLMLGNGRDMALNPVMWTLVHEMRISLVLPLMFLALRRFGVARVVASCVLASLAASVGLHDLPSGSLQATVHILWMFAAGAALSLHRERLRGWLRGLGAGPVLLAWCGAILLLAVPFDRNWSDFLIGSGAAIVIALCLVEGRVTRWLTTPVPLWLGRVSYSLYLVNLPVIMVVVGVRITAWPGLGALLVMPVAAEAVWRTIEAPAHRLGIRLSRGRLAAPPSGAPGTGAAQA